MSFTLGQDKILLRLSEVTVNADDVQKISLWLLHHKKFDLLIVQCWLKAVSDFDMEKIIPLFYVCNELVQSSQKTIALNFRSAFANVLPAAIQFVSSRSESEKIRGRITRILSVWADRGVYPPIYLDLLTKRLEYRQIGDDDFIIPYPGLTTVGELTATSNSLNDGVTTSKARSVVSRLNSIITCRSELTNDVVTEVCNGNKEGQGVLASIESGCGRRERFIGLLKGRMEVYGERCRENKQLLRKLEEEGGLNINNGQEKYNDRAVKRPANDEIGEEGDSDDSPYDPENFDPVSSKELKFDSPKRPKLAEPKDLNSILNSMNILEPFKKVIGNVVANRNLKITPKLHKIAEKQEFTSTNKLYDDFLMEYSVEPGGSNNPQEMDDILSDGVSVTSTETVLQDENMDLSNIQVRDDFQTYSLSCVGNLAEIGISVNVKGTFEENISSYIDAGGDGKGQFMNGPSYMMCSPNMSHPAMFMPHHMFRGMMPPRFPYFPPGVVDANIVNTHKH